MSLKNAIGGVAFIAGTAIGAAVLTLPVATAHLGILSTAAYYVLTWLFMTISTLYILEVNLYVGYGSNLISMAEKTLGKFGTIATYVIYLLLLYALISAYLSGCGAWINSVLPQNTPKILGPCMVALIAWGLIICKTRVSDWINRLIMLGLVSSFIMLLVLILPHSEHSLVMRETLIFDVSPFPLIITAFGFAIIVPTLTEYLHGNERQLKWVILIGSTIPILMYLIWEYAILSTVPLDGPDSLMFLQKNAHPEILLPELLAKHLNTQYILSLASCFSIFAITSSMLGVALSLLHFLADGLNIEKNLVGKTSLGLMTFLPALALLYYLPTGFSQILSLAGIFVSLLLGILPALMVWQLRYRIQKRKGYTQFFHKTIITVTILFFLSVIVIEMIR